MYNYILSGDNYVAVPVKSDKTFHELADLFFGVEEYRLGSFVIKNPKIWMVSDFVGFLPIIL